MSKQYLAQHTIDDAHTTDIFALAATPTQTITGSGSPDLKIHSTTSTDFTQDQVLKNAHPLGCHHIAISRNHLTLVSVGFGGEAKIWKFSDGIWKPTGEIPAAKKAGELWAVALDSEGRFLVGTTYDGRNNVWELTREITNEKTGEEKVVANKFAEYETRGGFGLAVDVSPDNSLTATSHPTGNIYIFSSSTTRLTHSLPTQASPVRTLKFSPGSTLLAAAGDSSLISLYDAKSGETVALLRGHEAWITSLDWSYTGEYLVSGSLDGKIKIWSVETRQCVCTMTDGEGRGLWAVKWLPKGETSGERGKAERFVTAGNGGAVGVYREASGAS
ncbi:Ski complex subunit Rec14 [Knufia obscura]|uniref:Ski complex subunit Rec14 n=2 Tax=Knufia TaxID=430999 RepID=A0AAN8I7I2_9EURO|nr:Ski complex subunit Rec14 [Knufia obscura]KAK5955939.1 Ski complex subunit Rec14 [Knufia fluminis]